MSSDHKPKVICKNLQDIIKESMFSTKRSSFENAQKRQCFQRILKSEPKQRRSNQRCNTSVNRENRLYQSGKRLNTSKSKHSLELKEKIKIIQNKITSNTSGTKLTQHKKSKNSVLPTSSIQFYPSSLKSTKQTPFQHPTKTHFKSLCFNQVDAILTQLEDFIRQTREKICLEMDFMSEENVANMLAEQLAELSSVFKRQLSGVIDRSLYVEGDNQVLKPKNRMRQVNINEKNSTIAYSSSKQPTQHQTPFQQQLIKIQQFMQRQNTINSTINSQPFQDRYIPTQTDAQILSMLVYKNKINSTKRKLQSTDYHGQELMSPWVKSGRNPKDPQADYSFRNKNSKDKDLNSNSVLKEVDLKRKKNNNNPGQVAINNKENREKSTYTMINKQNREKSIYQMVLQENRKTKSDWKR